MRSDAYTLLRSKLEQIEPLSERNWLHMKSQFKSHVIKKHEYLLRAGEASQHLAFVVTGVLRMYYLSVDGHEFNRSFASEGHFYGAYRSALLQEPADFSIQALEDCELLLVNYRKLVKDPVWRQYDFRMLQQLVVIKEKRESQFLLLTPEQRYQLFLEDHPGLARRVADRHIASYLGITAVSLSRIKNKSKS